MYTRGSEFRKGDILNKEESGVSERESLMEFSKRSREVIRIRKFTAQA